jgi:hypothetical protein
MSAVGTAATLLGIKVFSLLQQRGARIRQERVNAVLRRLAAEKLSVDQAVMQLTNDIAVREDQIGNLRSVISRMVQGIARDTATEQLNEKLNANKAAREQQMRYISQRQEKENLAHEAQRQ